MSENAAVDKFSVIVEDEDWKCPVEREVLGGCWVNNVEYNLRSMEGILIHMWMYEYHKDEWEKLVGYFKDGKYEDGGTISVECVGALGFRYPVNVYRVTMEKVRKEEARICEKCKHYGDLGWIPNWPFDDFGYICRRRQVKSVNPVSGFDKWDGKVLKCMKEREIDVSWWERLVGKWWGDRCGKEGKYWERRK